mgnify:CR=1 FL=1
MDKKKLINVAIGIAAFIIPFGFTALTGYYFIKKYKKCKEDKLIADSKLED